MATVFLATQTSFERKVALKIIADSAFGGQSLADQFMSEAKIIGSFSHPHIVPVYDVGRIEQFHYLAMDYLQGGDLSSWIKSGLTPEESEQIIIQIAKALHFAHGKGYIHRDIKPDNILFREDNSAVLTDFGIAQPLLKNSSESSKRERIVVGTPAYMSPEQSQGKAIDARSDLYSLGVMFYQMLTREQPYHADNSKVLLIKHIKDPIPKLPFALQRYQPIIDNLMAKNSDERFQSALEFIKALENLAEHPDMNEVITSIADLKLVDKEPEKEESQSLVIEENSYRKLGLAKRYALNCSIKSNESQHFLLLFSQFTRRLIEWHNQHGGQCGKIHCEITIDPMLAEVVKNSIDQVLNDENFDFLKRLKPDFKIIDTNG